jgi:hypothetical protein
MPTIRLLREVNAATGTGPGNGQHALQRALRAQAPRWLRIGGMLGANEIPWFWCWLDREMAAMCAAVGRPFVVGPNMLFENSRQPCRVAAEREICNAAACRLMFTESAWYGELIESYRGPLNRAPLVLWPYPIEPKPRGPLRPRYDLLIYLKRGHFHGLAERLRQAFPRSRLLVYGQYGREELLAAARRARCCAYLSDDDRGPLALAEILLAGCPAVGVPHGAPWIVEGWNGCQIATLRLATLVKGIETAQGLDRHRVRQAALDQFDIGKIVATILKALRLVANGGI